MSKLTPKQEMFCQEFIKCGNASEAYRTACDVGEDTKPESIWQSACRMMAADKVSSRVYELQQVVLERTLVTVDNLTEDLSKAFVVAEDIKQPSAMVSATMGKAKLHGLDINKIEVVEPITVNIGSDDKDL